VVDEQQELGEMRRPGEKPQTFRSPVAVAVWWVWVLFAVGNLADLAIQGRDHSSAVAAAILIFVTGVVFVTAQLPKVIAAPDSLKVRNPLRDHLIGWGAITKVDNLDLLRVHCEWPSDDGTQQHKVFHAWAVQHSRRREMAQQTRETRRGRRGLAPNRPDSARAIDYAGVTGFAAAATTDRNRQPSVGSAQYAVEFLKARLDEAREQHPAATWPVSTWRWPAIAAIVIPAILLAIIAAF
jgi:hypothetical protein